MAAVKISREIPIGISKEYDLLPLEGSTSSHPCQLCPNTFIDGQRNYQGSSIMAVICPTCRSKSRLIRLSREVRTTGHVSTKLWVVTYLATITALSYLAGYFSVLLIAKWNLL